jgi:hypothetical protein
MDHPEAASEIRLEAICYARIKQPGCQGLATEIRLKLAYPGLAA